MSRKAEPLKVRRMATSGDPSKTRAARAATLARKRDRKFKNERDGR